mgnify:CR=1 FL=1
MTTKELHEKLKSHMDGKDDYHVELIEDYVMISHDNEADIFPSGGLLRVMDIVDINKARFYFAIRNERACMIILWA